MLTTILYVLRNKRKERRNGILISLLKGKKKKNFTREKITVRDKLKLAHLLLFGSS